MFFNGWMREGFLSWFPSYFEEVHGIETGSSLFTIATTGITIGGMIGALLAGFISDHYFHSRRSPVVLVYFFMQIVCLLVFYLSSGKIPAVVMTGAIFWHVVGCMTMIDASSTDMAGAKLSGIAGGFMNSCQYLGSGLGPLVTGYLVDNYGWDAWFYGLLPLPVLGFLLFSVIEYRQQKNMKEK